MIVMEKEGYFSRRKRKFLKRATPFLNRIALACRWSFRSRQTSTPHMGNIPLVVSLTSYPPRFPTLHLTIKSLLLQRLQPTRLILWIADADAQHLPDAVKKLQVDGLEIRYCEDLKSYKKIIPALEVFPDSIVVTADDDIYYWPDWLWELIQESKKYPVDVIAHRVHRIQYDGMMMRPYCEWLENVADGVMSGANFATGIGGILYPPGCFKAEVLAKEKFMDLCPNADDVWLYWMTRLNGRRVRRSSTHRTPYPWRGSQEVSLWKENRSHNDMQITKMINAYGIP